MRRGSLRGLARSLFATVLIACPACATPGHERLPSVGVAELGEAEQVLRVRVESYYFEPSRLVVKVGVPVRLVVENGTLLRGHDFSLFAPDAGMEVNAYVPARQTVTVQFLPDAVGEYRFYCNIDDHMDRGMTGTLEVVERLPGEPGRTGRPGPEGGPVSRPPKPSRPVPSSSSAR